MNTYNDNLRSTVLSTLSAQELELSNLKAGLITSEVTLYYDQGAAARAEYKLARTNEKYDTTKGIFDTAVVDGNISANVKTDADTFKDSNALAVTNTAVAAANLQASANAILRLARTVGGIFSITDAADFGQEIYTQSKRAAELMAVTAYDAERASEMGMNASASIAEVASATVAAEAKTTDDMMIALEAAITTDFNAASAEVDTRSKELATAIDQEKLAEGVVEINSEQYFAAQAAYANSNDNLNLNLQVAVSDDAGVKSYKVSFNGYKSPFDKNDTGDSGVDNPPITHGPVMASGYPVDTYYIMLVKNRLKTTFSIAEAEAVIAEKDRRVAVECKSGACGDPITQIITQDKILDSEGKPMLLGQNYVVFVLAVFNTGYKKMINNFDDFLSAPSAVFVLKNKLKKPGTNTIKVTPSGNVIIEKGEIKLKEKVDGGEVDITLDGEIEVDYIPNSKVQTLTFNVEGNSGYAVEYRCMFLQASSLSFAGLLSEAGTRNWDTETTARNLVRAEFGARINEHKTKRTTILTDLAKLNDQIHEKERKARDLQEEISRFTGELTPEQKEQLKKLQEKLAKVQTETEALKVKAAAHAPELETIAVEISKLTGQRNEALKKPIRLANSVPGLLFNLRLAELIPQSIYRVADPASPTSPPTDDQNFKLELNGTMTDNFGNPLRKGNKYVPVILSAAKGDESLKDQFENALSDFKNTTAFYYLGA
jgi:hypothetical protein